MNEIAEFGAAAEHWRYKIDKIYRKGKIPRVTKVTDQIWSHQLAQLRKSLANEQESTEQAQEPLLKNQIFVITPKGHVIDLRTGATPLDFAYRIHTDLGHRYTGAKVNGHIVRLNYKLKNGEIVELITSRSRTGPSPEWLTKSKDEEGKSTYVFARTPNAREKIHRELNKQKPKTQK
jgi:GTP pyrophosphokinase